MSLRARKRLKWAVFVAILVGVVVLPGVPIASDWLDAHLWAVSESGGCRGGVNVVRVCKGDRLLFVLAWSIACEKSVSWDAQREVLLVDGKDVSLPAGIKAAAIRDDGTVAAIHASQVELDRLRTCGNWELDERIRDAVWGPPAGQASTRPGQ